MHKINYSFPVCLHTFHSNKIQEHIGNIYSQASITLVHGFSMNKHNQGILLHRWTHLNTGLWSQSSIHSTTMSVKYWFITIVKWYQSSIGLPLQWNDLSQVLVYHYSEMISVKYWFVTTMKWSQSSFGLSTQCHDLSQVLVYYK